jgi:hypothetical protein
MQPPFPGSVQNARPAGFLSRWLFSWRVVLLLPVFVIALIALFYGEEDWRGWHAWNKYRRTLEAQGERLDLKAFIPPPIPAEQNFAATPFIESWFHQRTSERWEDDYTQVAGHVTAPTTDGAGRRKFVDLVAWAMGFDAGAAGEMNRKRKFQSGDLDRASRAKAAPVVLRGLKSSEVALAELHSVSRRPAARYPVNYDLENPWGILLPHLANVKKACQRLQLHACAELAAGQSEPALEDVKLMFRLADSLKGEPFLISYLVRVACLQLALQPVWEGLAEQRWSEAQLQALQTALQQYNFVADMKSALEAEQAAGVLTVELVRTKGLTMLMSMQSQGSVPPAGQVLASVLGMIIPRGWYYQEQLNYCRLRHLLVGEGFDVEHRRISPEQIASNAQEFERIMGQDSGPARAVSAILHHRFLSAMLLPALGKVGSKAAVAQTAADEAALGCALERYRLGHGQTPETLEALVPQLITPLPHDVITGEAFKYRRTADGHFVLYSLGWNGQDDGGLPGNVPFDEKRGDWVWSYQAE